MSASALGPLDRARIALEYEDPTPKELAQAQGWALVDIATTLRTISRHLERQGESQAELVKALSGLEISIDGMTRHGLTVNA